MTHCIFFFDALIIMSSCYDIPFINYQTCLRNAGKSEEFAKLTLLKPKSYFITNSAI